METLKRILIKTCSNLFSEFTRGSLLRRSVINSMHSFSPTTLITLPSFPLLICKRILQVEFLRDILVHIQLEVLNIGKFKMFNTVFKPEVLKVTTFKRWNETVFQNLCGTYWLSKKLFKNVCINPILKDKVLTII